MIYAVTSDLHANLEAFERVLADAKACGADAVVCLGDIVGYGPLPAETLKAAREACSVIIAGNHDDAVSSRLDESEFIDLAADAVKRHRKALASGDIAFLKSLPHTARIEGAALAHGDFTEPEAFHYVRDEEDAAAEFSAVADQLAFVGHTHECALFLTGASGKVYRTDPQDFALEEGKRYIVNPGSVGYPRESHGECFSSYVLYDSVEKTVVFRRIPFAVSSVLERGAGPKRRLVPIIAAVALAAGAAAVCAFGLLRTAPRQVAAADGAGLVVKTVYIALKPGDRFVSPGFALDRKAKSPPADLRVTFKDAEGKSLGSVTQTVKAYTKKEIQIPEGAAGAEFTVLKTRAEDEPVIYRLNPTATR